MSIRTVERPGTAAYNPGSRILHHDYEPGLIRFQSCRRVRSRQGQFGYSCLARRQTKRRGKQTEGDPQSASRRDLARRRGRTWRHARRSLRRPTGGYERHVLAICLELGVAVHKAHGSRVRYFARYLGLLAKTDPIDARVLALYGLKTTDLRLYVPPAPGLALRDLRTRRDQLQQMLFAELNRLEHARHLSVSRSLKAHIASLRKALAALEAEIAACLKASETLARKARLMKTLKGVGPATVAAILAYMPEIGAFTKAGAACMAGLAPINDDSGETKGPRHIEAGEPLSARRSIWRRSSPSSTIPSCASSPINLNGMKRQSRHYRRHAKAHRHLERHPPLGRTLEPCENRLTPTG